MLNYKSNISESEERIRYVEDMKKKIKEELKICKRKYKKYEERDISKLLKSRKATLVKKLNNLEETENNKQLKSDIELAIDLVNKYISLEEALNNGLITSEEFENKTSNTYSIVDYVLSESNSKIKRI